VRGRLTRPIVNRARARVQTSLDSLSTHSLFFAPFQRSRTIVPRANPLMEARIVSSMIPVTKNSLTGCLDVIIAKGSNQYGVPMPSLIPDSSFMSIPVPEDGAHISSRVINLGYKVGRDAIHQLRHGKKDRTSLPPQTPP
jgi:hypothetical protein